MATKFWRADVVQMKSELGETHSRRRHSELTQGSKAAADEKEKTMTMFQDVRTRTMAKRGIAVASAIAVLVCGVVPAYAWWRPVLIGPPYWAPYYAPPVVVEPSLPPVVVQPATPPVVVQPTPPPVVVQPPAPQVYVQPDDRAAYFYYCDSAKAYYPNVKDCPQGWTRVAPQPTGGAAK